LPEARDQQRDFLRIEGQVRGASSEDLTDENAKLKKLLAEAMLDNPMLINSKNGDTRRDAAKLLLWIGTQQIEHAWCEPATSPVFT
jgi:hypothetical protein